MQNPPNHPLHGAGCSTNSLWMRVHYLFQSTMAAHADVVSNQFTDSIAFDNWKQKIQKIWQTLGSSNNYLKSVASYLKNEKAILLPVGSIFTSPLGLRFV